MTDNTQPEALRLAEILEGDYCPDWFYEQGVDEVAAELRRQHTRIAELESELEAIGAGGVSGPLMGIATDMSKEREALRTIGEEQAFEAWFKMDCPVEGANAKIAATAAWKARASLAANAGEPVAWMTFTEEGDPDMVFLDRLEACQYCEDDDPPKPLYLAAIPTAQAEGWTATAQHQTYRCKIKSRKQIDKEIPRDQQGWWADVAAGKKLLLRPAVQADIDRCHLGPRRSKNPDDYMCETQTDGSLVSKIALEYMNPEENVFAAIPASPTSAEGVELANCKGGKWLTVVYRDIQPGDEARTIGEHPKVSALSWSHALHDRDAALAAKAKQGERP